MPIQWFPGHMTSARKNAAETMARIDVVIEVLDARVPQAGSNPLINSSSPRRRGSSLLIGLGSRLRGNDKIDLISASLDRLTALLAEFRCGIVARAACRTRFVFPRGAQPFRRRCKRRGQ